MAKAAPGRRTLLFWAGCLALILGVGLHLPMYAHSLGMGHSMAERGVDSWMLAGMALIAAGGAAAFVGALPQGPLRLRRAGRAAPEARYGPPDAMRLGPAHAAMMLVLVFGLVIDVMKPATLGFVLPGMAGEYGISRSTAALLPFVAGLAGGWLAASSAAALFEPEYGWRSLWLQGFPTGIALLVLARFIPESPDYLAAQGRTAELAALERRFGIAPAGPSGPPPPEAVRHDHRRVTLALVVAGLAWSFVNFGLLLWLPSDLQARGYGSGLASGIIASSALIALPTVAAAALLYSRWSSKWTLVGALLLAALSLAFTLLIDRISDSAVAMVAVVALLIIGSNAVIALLLPYAAENYRLGVRGRGTGTIAGASKLGGVAVQGSALAGFVPAFGGAALVLIVPIAFAALLVALAGPETRGRALRELERVTG